MSDYFAVSNDGTNYDLSYADKNAKIACTHNYSVQVEVTKHIKNSNGGCTMKTYNGLKCSKCNDIKYDELLYTATYMPCPH